MISRSNRCRRAAHGGHFGNHDSREQGRGGNDGGCEPCAPLTVGLMHEDLSFPQQERRTGHSCDNEASVSRMSVSDRPDLEDDSCVRLSQIVGQR
jgi:hypothetical protein